MSKHHHYHQSQSGNYHATKKSHLGHTDYNHTTDSHIHHNHHERDAEMISQPSNGVLPRLTNGTHNGEIDSNDTNNNYNKHHHHHHHHHRDNKRSAGVGSEAGSSKRTKLSNSQSVPSEKGKPDSVGNLGGAAVVVQGHYNIMDKLKELYRELKRDRTCKELHLSSSSFLLDKLVTRERLNTLIINLYPGNKGYSLAFRSPTVTPKQMDRENIHETPSWLYDNAHLLDALDAEELPPLLIDFCNVHCPHLYYSGAVIAQVRDYRQSYPMDICDIHYVLLRSTSAAHWDEINSADDGSWSVKERTALESQLVLATAPPICLDPSPSIGIAAINATTECAPFTHDGVRKMAKKFLQVTKNRNNKLEKKTLYPEAALANHIAAERRGVRRDVARSIQAPRLPQMSFDGVEAIALSSVKNLPVVQPSTRYDWQPRNTERLTFETDRDNCQYRVRVELFERAPTCEVSGQLTLERQKGGSGQSSGRMCPFKLSSPLAARRYVKEFMGIFTEEGRKFVKITHERETKAGVEKMEMQTGEKIGSAQPPKIQTIPVPSTSITSPPPPALVATPALKLTTPQRIITTRPSPGQQVVVLAQVKQESNGNQVIKNLLNQPRAPMTQTMVNGLNPPEVQTLYLQVDQSNLIHMGSAVPANLQFQQYIATPVTQATPTYTMNVQTVTPVVKRHRDM